MFEGLIGSLVSGGASLLNGIFNRGATKALESDAINAQGEAQYNAPINVARGATFAEKDTGINRLALLGVNPASGPSLPTEAPDAGIGQAGQDISRAMTAYADKSDKAAALSNELTQAKINQVNASTAGQQLENSRIARTFASPGTPPGLAVRPDGSAAHPYPAYSYYDMGDGHTIRLLSHEAASTQFGPTSYITGAELLPGMAIHQAGDTGAFIAPHVARSLDNLQLPDLPAAAPFVTTP